MDYYFLLYVILLLVGVVLAFFGRSVWESLMSVIGGFIGWFIGFAMGMHFFEGDPNRWLYAIILGFICGLIGSWLFGMMVEVALALVTGALAGGLVYAMGGMNPAEGWIAAAIITFVIVFALAYYYIDELIGIITAMIGGILAGAALWLLWDGDYMAGVFGFLIFLGGALVQTFVWDD